MARIPIGPSEPGERRRSRTGLTMEERIDLVFEAGAAAVARTDGTNAYGTVDGAVNGYGLERRMWEMDAPPPITEWILAAEHYNRMVRILEKSIPVEMEAERYHGRDEKFRGDGGNAGRLGDRRSRQAC